MAGRRVFFSFHYEADIWRATNLRNSNIVDPTARAGFVDASLWEEVKRKGDAAIRGAIEEGLRGTSVTAVLIGEETANRHWVKYEIKCSIERGNGLLGIRIDNIKDQHGKRGKRGPVPEALRTSGSQVYSWDRNKFRLEVERAAIDAGKPCLAHDTKGCFWCRASIWFNVP